MAVTTKTLAQYTSDLVAAWSAALGISTNLPAGDPLLAMMQSVAAQLLFLQGNNQQVLAASRLATSTGADVDSFLADFGTSRTPATYAWGPLSVTATNPLPSGSGTVTLAYGAQIQSSDGTINFTVIPQPSGVITTAPPTTFGTTQTAGTTLAGGVFTVYAQANVAGTAGNVPSGSLITLVSPVSGVLSVSNATPMNNGAAAASDPVARTSFLGFLQGLSQATYSAILTAVNKAIPGVPAIVTDYYAFSPPSTLLQPGFVYVVYQDPTGLTNVITNTNTATLGPTIVTALQASEAFGLQPIAYACAVTPLAAQILFTVAGGYQTNLVASAIQLAVSTYLTALPIGSPADYDALVTVARSVVGVAEINALVPTGSVFGGGPGTAGTFFTVNSIAQAVGADALAPNPLTLLQSTLASVSVFSAF